MRQYSSLLPETLLEALTHDTSLLDLRASVSEFCDEHLPEDLRSKTLRGQHLTKADYLRWLSLLRQKGWLAGHWPAEHGGLGWSKLERWVLENELQRKGAPRIIPFGVTYVAPVIYAFGTKAQQDRWLKPTLDGEIWWAQGYSEPGAGSDLAGLRTTAVRDGDFYIVNGQKTWTTMAQWADMMFALVRTSASQKPQQGISFLLIDMKALGVTMRPIGTIDFDHHVNEVFLDDVRVPAANLIGEEGQGWSCAKFLLENERLLAAEVGKAKRLMATFEQLLGEVTVHGRAAREDQAWRRRAADLASRIMALECLALKLFIATGQGRDAAANVSILKILGSELLQAITGATIDLLQLSGLGFAPDALDSIDPAATDRAPGAIAAYLHGRATTIYGGSGEVQRNIAARALGLT